MPEHRLPITTLTSRDFNQDTGRAKKAAADGAVFITDRGKPAHVLLSIEEYQRLTGKRLGIVDMLSTPPGVADIEVEFPRSRELPRAADFDQQTCSIPTSSPSCAKTNVADFAASGVAVLNPWNPSC